MKKLFTDYRLMTHTKVNWNVDVCVCLCFWVIGHLVWPAPNLQINILSVCICIGA